MRIGVLGGGQLGRMLGLAGIPLGLEFRFFDPSPEVPAHATGDVVRARYDDTAALERFAEDVDVITYEFENVPATTLDLLGDKAVIRPGRRALEISQDRVREKSYFAEAGVNTGEWMQVDSFGDLTGAVGKFGPSVIKTRRLGYDGKGQMRIKDVSECAEAWQKLSDQPLIAEKLVPFDRELSLIGVRSNDGDIRMWPVVENVHNNGILHQSTAPAPRLSAEMQKQAEGMLSSLLESLDYVGVLTIELFEVDGMLLANEIAPRVHNSGHWTIEGAVTDQFENHTRAVAGLPLGSTALRCPSIMLNCIGSMPPVEDVLNVPGAHLHDYGKTPRPGRKVGHVTILDEPSGGQPLSDKVSLLEPLIVAARHTSVHV